MPVAAQLRQISPVMVDLIIKVLAPKGLVDAAKALTTLVLVDKILVDLAKVLTDLTLAVYSEREFLGLADYSALALSVSKL